MFSTVIYCTVKKGIDSKLLLGFHLLYDNINMNNYTKRVKK